MSILKVNQLQTVDGTYTINVADLKASREVTPDQFGAVGDGVTDDSVAFANMLAYAVNTGKAIKIPAKTYISSTTLVGNFLQIEGEHALYSRIKSPGTAPIIRAGGISVIKNLSLSFTDASAATLGTHVAIYCGTDQSLCKGSVIKDVRFDEVGTAIYDKEYATFSVTFENIDIRNYYYAALLFTSDYRTDNFFSNIYLGATYSNPGARAQPQYGICFKGLNDTGSVMTNINIESIKSSNAFYIEDVSHLKVDHLHIEDWCPTNPGDTCVLINRSSVIFGVIDFWYSPIKNNSALLRITNTIRYMSSTLTQDEQRILTVGRLDVLGMYLDEARTNSDTSSVTGFMLIDRPLSSDTGVFEVSVNSYAGHSFSGTDTANYNLVSKTTTNALIRKLDKNIINPGMRTVAVSGGNVNVAKGTAMVEINVSAPSTITLPKATTGYTERITLLRLDNSGAQVTLVPASGDIVSTAVLGNTTNAWELISDGFGTWFLVKTAGY